MRIVELGYSPIPPQIINSRTGVYMTVLALFRLPEVTTNHDLILYLTSQIGKDLAIDPYELLSPLDYRTVSGTRKLEYRTQADSRAYTLINELINDCKFLNRELVNLTKLTDVPDKVEYIVDKASKTFKRIVSLKEYSFGGAYLLDEDIFEHLKDFETQVKEISILASSALNYTDLVEKVAEITTLVKSPLKLENLKNDDFKQLFFKAHELTNKLSTQVNKKIDDQRKMTRVIDESITYSKDFITRAGKSADLGFEVSGFKALPQGLTAIKDDFLKDLNSLNAKFNSLYKEFLSAVPDQIKNKGNVNPSHLISTAKKYSNSIDMFMNGLTNIIHLEYKQDFTFTKRSISTFYVSLSGTYKQNKSFKDSCDKSFKLKKLLTL